MTPEYKKSIEDFVDNQLVNRTNPVSRSWVLSDVRLKFVRYGVDAALEVANKYIKRLVILGEIEWTSKIK